MYSKLFHFPYCQFPWNTPITQYNAIYLKTSILTFDLVEDVLDLREDVVRVPGGVDGVVQLPLCVELDEGLGGLVVGLKALGQGLGVVVGAADEGFAG